jgi:two-component system phosphate regulon response regulator OmpR
MQEPLVLVVEDDPPFAEELVEFLESYGYRTLHFATLAGLAERVGELRPDALVLDQFVAGRDALQMLGAIRRAFGGGILLLTGNESQVDRIVALESGADDFVMKSLGSRELLARLRAVLRRVHPAGPAEPDGVSAAPAAAGNWQLDLRRLEVTTPDGSRVGTTHAEFDCLCCLARSFGRIVGRGQLCEAALHRPFHPADRSIDNLVSRVRRIIEPYLEGRVVIRSVRGQGYIFTGFGPGPDGGVSIVGEGRSGSDTIAVQRRT